VRHDFCRGRSTRCEGPAGVAKVKKSLAGGKKRPTIEAVAKQAGVSRQTVSNAANAPHRLRPETLQKVLGTINELGYRPSQAARSLRTSATHVIGCRLLPANFAGTGGILDRLLHALCDAARAKGYGVLTFSAANDDDEIGVLDDLLRRKAVDGFVLANTHHGDVRPGWLTEQGARFVAFGRPWGVARPGHSWVDVDGASGTSQAVHHLVELGHSRVGFLGLPQGSGVGDDRFQGWQAAVGSLGLPAAGLVARAEDGIVSGHALAEELMTSVEPPTALVCVSDAMAVGALRAAEDRGLAVGRDFSVVGFDDSPVASVLRPRLSSVRQPVEDVAHKLVEVLLAELSGAQRRPSRELLTPWLVARESSGEPGTTAAHRSGTDGGGAKRDLFLRGSNRKEQNK
jgi:DNA-binding LacI/PurR family transcriptional regulator